MHHMIQIDMYAEFGFRRLVDAMQTLKLPYSIFKLRHFDHYIEVVDGIFPESTQPTMLWGVTTVEQLAQAHGWMPGVFKNANFNHRVLNENYGSSMLNSDGQFYKLGEIPSFEGARFIRPVLDSKSFTGQLLNGDEFEKWREELYAVRREYTTLDLNTEVMISSPKRLIDEARFFIVDKKVITGSMYRVDGRLLYKEINNTPLYNSIWNYAEAHAQTFEGWTPCEAFVMDIARVEPGDSYASFKIIEINCLNTAGFYDSNMTAVVKAIENL